MLPEGSRKEGIVMIKHIGLSFAFLTSITTWASGIPLDIRLTSSDADIVSATATLLIRATHPIQGLCGKFQWAFPLPLPYFMEKHESVELDVLMGTATDPSVEISGEYHRGLCGFETSTLTVRFNIAGDSLPYTLRVFLMESDRLNDPEALTARCTSGGDGSGMRHTCHTPYRPVPSIQADNMFHTTGAPVRHQFDLSFAP